MQYKNKNLIPVQQYDFSYKIFVENICIQLRKKKKIDIGLLQELFPVDCRIANEECQIPSFTTSLIFHTWYLQKIVYFYRNFDNSYGFRCMFIVQDIFFPLGINIFRR